VQPRATDYLSAAVEQRARGRAAIAAGEDPGVEVSKKSPYGRRPKAAPTMEAEAEEMGIQLRPTKGPVEPVPKSALLPSPRISADQDAILSRLSPAPPEPREVAPVREAPPPRAAARVAEEPVQEARPAADDWGRRKTRSVEVPEPVERHHAPREFYVPEWDRYYNPNFMPSARIPQMRINRSGGPPPDAPAWALVGRPRSMGVPVESRAPYRASLKDGAEVKSSKPRQEVSRYLEHRAGMEADLDGPAEVPDEEGQQDASEAARKSEFERAMADLEESFRSQSRGAKGAPAPIQPPAPSRPTQAPRYAPPAQAPRSSPSAEVSAAATRAMPNPVRATSGPLRPISRHRGDEESEEDDAEIAAGEEEEGTIGKRPPPDHLQEAAARQKLPHDATGASLCPTCGLRVGQSNPVLVCTSCGRVACGSCGRFSAGEPTGNVYQYEYKFNFPLCSPCFERHFNVQKNLARARAYLASGNLTYAFYHAQTARQMDTDSPYARDADALIKQVEQRRAQSQKADKEWEDARRKLMRERTSVLK
jgi:hypothetical protein